MKECPLRPARRHTDRPETRAARPPARHRRSPFCGRIPSCRPAPPALAKAGLFRNNFCFPTFSLFPRPHVRPVVLRSSLPAAGSGGQDALPDLSFPALLRPGRRPRRPGALSGHLPAKPRLDAGQHRLRHDHRRSGGHGRHRAPGRPGRRHPPQASAAGPGLAGHRGRPGPDLPLPASFAGGRCPDRPGRLRGRHGPHHQRPDPGAGGPVPPARPAGTQRGLEPRGQRPFRHAGRGHRLLVRSARRLRGHERHAAPQPLCPARHRAPRHRPCPGAGARP